jgi:hypothetical protein
MPLGKTSNPLLQQTEQAIQSKIKPQFMPQFQKAVTAGMSLLYSPALHQKMVAGIQSSSNPEQNAALGAANLVGTMQNQSKNAIPVQLVAPVALVLMCEILDFISQVGKVQVTPQLIAQCSQDTAHAVLVMMGINQQQMHQVVAKGVVAKNGQSGQSATPSQAASSSAPAPAAPQSGGIIGGIIGGAMGGQ